jgi:hypothetical protein
VAATPLGYPILRSSDGTAFNGARSGRLRIVPNGVGPGYELQFDRSFGVDSRGRPETLHLGGLGDLTLSGATQMTLGYNGKKFRTISGDVNVNSLAYDLKTKIGVQDAELTGTLSAANTFYVNPLGFYDLTLQVSNTNSTLKLDGVVVRDSDPTNFDVGPISIKGNLYVDGAASLLKQMGVDTSGIDQLFPESPIDQINAAIAASTQSTDAAANATASSKNLASLLLQTVLGHDETAGTQLMQSLAAGATISGSSDAGTTVLTAIPEPGTLLLLAAGSAAALRRWRR